jgi:hypothetical protein
VPARIGSLVFVAFFAGGVDFTHTITLGSLIVGVIVGLAGLAVLAHGARWKANYEIERARADSLDEGREAYEKRSRRLEQELKEAQAQSIELAQVLGDAKETIARLEQLPNLERVIGLMAETSRRQDAEADRRLAVGIENVERFVQIELAGHEKRAQERHEAQLGVLTLLSEAVAT